MTEYREQLDRAAKLITASRKITAFTGAGMSAESGIPTFRGDDGIWKKFNPAFYGNIPGLAMHRIGDFQNDQPQKNTQIQHCIDVLCDFRNGAGLVQPFFECFLLCGHSNRHARDLEKVVQNILRAPGPFGKAHHQDGFSLL